MIEHHVSVIPLVGFYPISHMGHAIDLGAALKSLPGKKIIGISDKACGFTNQERVDILDRQWGQPDLDKYFTKSGGDTIGYAFNSLPEDGKKHLHILVGADRQNFGDRLKEALIAGKIHEMNGQYWDSIQLHHLTNDNREHGFSGTKMRLSASVGDYTTFGWHMGWGFSSHESRALMERIRVLIDDGDLKIKR